MTDQTTVMRKRGRPCVHGPHSTVISIRAAKTEVIRMAGLISTIKLAEQMPSVSDAAVILEALEMRARQMANRAPQVLKLAGVQ